MTTIGRQLVKICDEVPEKRFFVPLLRHKRGGFFHRFCVLVDDEDVPPDMRASGEMQTRCYAVVYVDHETSPPTIWIEEGGDVRPEDYVVEISIGVLFTKGANVRIRRRGVRSSPGTGEVVWTVKSRQEVKDRRSRMGKIALASQIAAK